MQVQAKELKFPEFKFPDFKIPQAVAYVLLISALATGQTAAPSGHPGSQDPKQQVEHAYRLVLCRRPSHQAGIPAAMRSSHDSMSARSSGGSSTSACSRKPRANERKASRLATRRASTTEPSGSC